MKCKQQLRWCRVNALLVSLLCLSVGNAESTDKQQADTEKSVSMSDRTVHKSDTFVREHRSNNASDVIAGSNPPDSALPARHEMSALKPLPLPTWKPPRDTLPRENRVVVYDVQSRTVTDYLVPMKTTTVPSRASRGFIGDIGDGRHSEADKDPDIVARNFSDMYKVDSPGDYPWRVNAKLRAYYPSSYGEGSGVLIDAKHVLTAGHVVYDSDAGEWADSIIVIPGYDDGFWPYGGAKGTRFNSWTGWTVSADRDWDMGVIELDRPVGAITSWHAYGYNNDNSFFSSNTFYNPGYPGEAPYNGYEMWHWSGTYDHMWSHMVYIEQMGFEGQSGSGSYMIDAGQRVVYAETSFRRSDAGTSYEWWTGHCRINSDKFDAITSIIESNTPNLDLVALDVNAGPDPIIGGQQLTSFDYLVHNNSLTSWSGTMSVDVYLSSNDNISSADVLLQTREFTHTFAPKGTLRLTSTSDLPTIPVWATGRYYIGIILNVSDDNNSNNDSDGDDCVPMWVEWAPPPQITGVNATNGECGEVTITWDEVPRVAAYRVYRDGVQCCYFLDGNTCTDAGGLSGIGYHYTVEAYNGNGDSPLSNYDLGWYVDEPAQVTGVTATDGSCSNIIISWNDVSDESGYKVYRDGIYWSLLGPDVTLLMDGTASCETPYFYQVRAYNVCGDGPLSLYNRAWAACAPDQVTGVDASDDSYEHVVITWNDISDETGYRIYRNGIDIGLTLPANSIQYTDVVGEGCYGYRVVAINSCGAGQWSTEEQGCQTQRGNTPQGADVLVDVADDLEVVFEDVSVEGVTTVVASSEGAPPPGGYQLYPISSPTWFDITTTATVSGEISVCLTYDESELTVPESEIRLFHAEGSPATWIDVTVLPVNETSNQVCGLVTSLSPFILVEPSGCCIGVRGNANGDGTEDINISDITYLVDYLFGIPLGDAPPCAEEGNANGDGAENINISDITYLVDYLFGIPLGPAPPTCP